MIQLTYDNVAQRGDLVRNGGNLVEGFDLETAVLTALLTERRASDDDAVDGDYRGGCWMDTDMTPFGSRLWLLRRAVATPAALARAKAYIEEALAWMLEDGVASSIVVRTSRGDGPTRLLFSIDIQRPAGVSLWSRAWEIQFGEL